MTVFREKREARSRELLRERALKIAGARSLVSLTEPFALFRRSHQLFGIPLTSLRFSWRADRMMEVPGAQGFIMGAVTADAALITVVDLVALYGLPMTGIADLKGVLVVESSSRRLGLACDAVLGAQPVETESILPLPTPLGAFVRSARFRGESVQLIEIPILFQHAKLNPVRSRGR